MFLRLSQKLIHFSTGWVVLISTLIFLVFLLFVLPAQSAQTDHAASPDTSFFYTADDLYQMAEAYGENGRAAYIRARYSFDVIWPLAYTLFLITATGWLAGKIFQPGSNWRMLTLVPLLGLLLDYLENISAVLVMARYPTRTPIVALLTPVFTLLKWLLVYASFAIPVVLLVLLGMRAVRKR